MKELDLKFTTEELNLILEGLGNLPFIRVYQLIDRIQQQAAQQVQVQAAANGQAETVEVEHK